MKDEDVTAQIMAAWEGELDDEERAEPDAAVVTEEPEPEEPAEGEEPEEESEEEAGDEEADEEEAEPGEEAEEVAEPAPEFEDVEVQAYLGKYQGDVEKALKGAAELQRLMGRQGQDKAQLSQQVEQLERELAQARAFSSSGAILNEEQQAWAEQAATSGNPTLYVKQAIDAGEFALARAVCREWASDNPFEATRVGQMIDAIEFQASQPAEPDPVPPATTWEALSNNYPELRTYEGEMVQTLGRLGPDHPLVQEARSTDPAIAVRGIFGIYEIAKAATFSLAAQRNGIKKQRRKEADEAAEAAVVTSAGVAPSVSETPRKTLLMPGLTQEDLDAEFDAEFARQ